MTDGGRTTPAAISISTSDESRTRPQDSEAAPRTSAEDFDRDFNKTAEWIADLGVPEDAVTASLNWILKYRPKLPPT